MPLRVSLLERGDRLIEFAVQLRRVLEQRREVCLERLARDTWAKTLGRHFARGAGVQDADEGQRVSTNDQAGAALGIWHPAAAGVRVAPDYARACEVDAGGGKVDKRDVEPVDEPAIKHDGWTRWRVAGRRQDNALHREEWIHPGFLLQLPPKRAGGKIFSAAEESGRPQERPGKLLEAVLVDKPIDDSLARRERDHFGRQPLRQNRDGAAEVDVVRERCARVRPDVDPVVGAIDVEASAAVGPLTELLLALGRSWNAVHRFRGRLPREDDRKDIQPQRGGGSNCGVTYRERRAHVVKLARAPDAPSPTSPTEDPSSLPFGL